MLGENCFIPGCVTQVENTSDLKLPRAKFYNKWRGKSLNLQNAVIFNL